MLTRLGRTAARTGRGLGLALLAWTLAFVVVAGTLRSGAHLFFCAEMGSLADHPCCAPPDDGVSPENAKLDGEDTCCARLDLGRLPKAATRAPEPIRAASLALVPHAAASTTRWALAPANEVRRARDAHERPPATAPERCARTRVFLI